MMKSPSKEALRAYGVAVLAVAGASVARFAVDPITHDKGPFLFFAFAVVVAALYGGLRAGITATIVSLAVGDYLFVVPRHTFFFWDAFGDSTMMMLFAALGVALSIIIERMNRANSRARQSHEDLAKANALLNAHQEDLELANERFRMATVAAKEAIWEWNVEKQTESWSDLYSERYGRQPEDTSGEWWFQHIHPDDREGVQSSFFGAVDGNATSWVCEYRMLCVDGSWAAIYDRGSIARDTDGRPLRVIGAMLDVTEIKRTQQELEQRTEELVRSNEQLQRFAFVVSHDLQAPLRMIEAFSQRLEREKLDEDADRLARGVLDAVVRMRAIIQDLLEFGQISVQPAPPTMRTDSNFILCLALQHLQDSIQQTQAQITSEHLPIVMVNDTRLLRVFQNLIGNAVKYCEQTPHIHISARRDGDMCVFSVKDNGIGIAPEHHERIFGLFERLHGRDQYTGTGIGLASVKRIIESQGGRIWVESDVGKGSTFYFTLEAATEAVTTHSA